MKKWQIWLISVAAAALVIGGIILAYSISAFLEPGVHILGKFAHIEMQKNCYFITDNGSQVTGQSTFTVSGYMHHNKPSNEMSSFAGHMTVSAYPVAFEDGYNNHSGYWDKDVITLSCQGIEFVRPDCDTFYLVQISRSDPDLIGIHIWQGSNSYFAICGESEEDALANYQKFWEEFGNRAGSDN